MKVTMEQRSFQSPEDEAQAARELEGLTPRPRRAIVRGIRRVKEARNERQSAEEPAGVVTPPSAAAAEMRGEMVTDTHVFELIRGAMQARGGVPRLER